METLDRYLKAIKPFLPKEHQDDILRELSESLRSQMEDKEAQLGRPLTEGEREAILDRHGPPLLVASRYRRGYRSLSFGRELIGPELYPHYIKWLSVVVVITAVIIAATAAFGVRVTPLRFVLTLATQFVAVTAVFIAVQASQRKYGVLDRWKPRSAPPPELLRRYLHAVRFWLPRGQRDDILAELAEDLRSKVEDREAELGRALDEGEMASILRERGDPQQVAAGYLPQQYLIGPALFPVYRFVLKLVVLWIQVPAFLLVVGPIAVRLAQDPGPAYVRSVWNLIVAAVFAVGVITVVFAVMERYPPRSSPDWDPRKLPPAPSAKQRKDEEAVSPILAIAEIVMSALFSLAWVYGMRSLPALDLEGVRISAAPVWQMLFWPILAVLLSGAATGVAGLLRPAKTRLRAGIRLAADGLSLVVVGILLNARTWVEALSLAPRKAGLEDVAKWIDLSVWITLLVVGVIVLGDTVLQARRTFRKTQAGGPAISGLAA